MHDHVEHEVDRDQADRDADRLAEALQEDAPSRPISTSVIGTS